MKTDCILYAISVYASCLSHVKKICQKIFGREEERAAHWALLKPAVVHPLQSLALSGVAAMSSDSCVAARKQHSWTQRNLQVKKFSFEGMIQKDRVSTEVTGQRVLLYIIINLLRLDCWLLSIKRGITMKSQAMNLKGHCLCFNAKVHSTCLFATWRNPTKQHGNKRIWCEAHDFIWAFGALYWTNKSSGSQHYYHSKLIDGLWITQAF